MRGRPNGLVVFDEPELGLHPDLIGSLADLLAEVAGDPPLLVLTHSAALLDRLEGLGHGAGLRVAEQHPSGNTITSPDLAKLRKEYPQEEVPLSELWTRGLIGGNRW